MDGFHWTFALLGPLEVRHRGALVAVPAQRQRVLLATLLLNNGDTVVMDELVDRIWSDAAPRNAASSVHSLVMRLRRTLAAELIQTRVQGYSIDVPADAIDLHRSMALWQHARRAGEAESAPLLRQALQLWRGEPLADIASDSLHRGEVPALYERWARLSEEYFQAELDAGRHREIVPALHEATARHRYREGVWGQLILALHRSGRQAEALDSYRKFSKILADELGLPPSPKLRQLQLDILQAEAGEDRQAVLPPAPALHLPADPGTLHGRAEQISHARSVFEAAAAAQQRALLCVSGAPGVGKTALALRVAHAIRAQYPDGQWYVPLRGNRTGDRRPFETLGELLGHAGVHGEAVPSTMEGRMAAWRSAMAQRRVLLLFDDAHCAEQVEPLLPGNSHCAVIVTSRAKLGSLVALHGGRAINIDVLDPRDAAELLGGRLRDHRIDVSDSFIRELAELCGYLPLALHIAAANIALSAPVSPHDYLRQIRQGDRLGALDVEGDGRTGVRAALERSYQCLDEPARLALRCLANAPTEDFTVFDVAALLGRQMRQAWPILQTLISAHLVQPAGSGRFRLHDLIRLYAAERSSTEDTEHDRGAALNRLFTWYIAAVSRSVRQRHPSMTFLDPPVVPEIADYPVDHSWIASEYRNLMAIIRSAVAQEMPGVVWQLADRMRIYQQEIGVHADWQFAGEAGLRQAERDGSRPGVAAMLRSLGSLAVSHAEYETGRRQFEASLAIYVELGDIAGEASMSNNLAVLYRELGELSTAQAFYERAIALDQQIGHHSGVFKILTNLSIVQLELDQMPAAIRSLTTALEGFRRIGASDVDNDIATALHNLGVITHLRGRVADAVMYLTRALVIHRYNNNVYGEANDLYVLAACHADLGYHAKALQMADESVAIARKISRRRLEAEALATRGVVHLALGDTEAALADVRRAVRLGESLGYRRAEIIAHTVLAKALRANGKHDEADRHAKEAVRVAYASQHHLLARLVGHV